MPPNTYQLLTPIASAIGPATINESGIMADEALPTNDITLPCMSGSTRD